LGKSSTIIVAGVAALALGFVAMYEYGDVVDEVMDHAAHAAYEPVRKALGKPQEPSRVVYLNREGARLTAAPVNDARKNVSSIVHNHGIAAFDAPAFRGTPTRWNQIRRCIADKFEPFNVQVVDQRPVEGDYIMAVIGGTPDGLPGVKEHGHAVTGLAPFNGLALPNAVVLIFSRSMKENVRDTCETAGMEIAHAYGLDHAMKCSDLMTYKRRCVSARRFVDEDVACGEGKARTCMNGDDTQNSYRQLMAILGPRP
jgi:hypothetical protein